MVKICEGFSRIDFFSKKECTGRTRLMRQEYRPKRRAKITKLFFKDYLSMKLDNRSRFVAGYVFYYQHENPSHQPGGEMDYELNCELDCELELADKQSVILSR